jgi:RNA polymerase sigma factor (TIGR02999 family)
VSPRKGSKGLPVRLNHIGKTVDGAEKAGGEMPAEESPRKAVTQLLAAWKGGSKEAMDSLAPIVYSELRHLALRYLFRERAAMTLQPTALVHEAYLRLVGHDVPDWESRSHFFGVAAHLMRQILVDHARAVATGKRGGRGKVTWDTNIEIHGDDGAHRLRVLEVHDALDALASENHSYAQVIEMHYFGGLTAAEMALATGKSIHIVQHELRFARAWLRRQMAAE